MITITKQDVYESVFNPCDYFIDNLPITGWVVDHDGIIIANEDGEGLVEWPLIVSETATPTEGRVVGHGTTTASSQCTEAPMGRTTLNPHYSLMETSSIMTNLIPVWGALPCEDDTIASVATMVAEAQVLSEVVTDNFIGLEESGIDTDTVLTNPHTKSQVRVRIKGRNSTWGGNMYLYGGYTVTLETNVGTGDRKSVDMYKGTCQTEAMDAFNNALIEARRIAMPAPPRKR